MAFALEPILHECLHDRVVRSIALSIMRSSNGTTGKDPITEADLCRRLKVSRSVVREAIKVVVAKGLLEVRPRMGIRARPRRKWNLSDPYVLSWLCELRPDEGFISSLCEARQLIEPAAAELAATRATPQEVSTICAAYERMASAPRPARKFIAADIDFHSAVIQACHNDVLVYISATLRKALRSSILTTSRVPGGVDRALRLHGDVADAIANHDALGARAAMHLLLDKTMHDIHELFRRNEIKNEDNEAKLEIAD